MFVYRRLVASHVHQATPSFFNAACDTLHALLGKCLHTRVGRAHDFVFDIHQVDDWCDSGEKLVGSAYPGVWECFSFALATIVRGHCMDDTGAYPEKLLSTLRHTANFT